MDLTEGHLLKLIINKVNFEIHKFFLANAEKETQRKLDILD